MVRISSRLHDVAGSQYALSGKDAEADSSPSTDIVFTGSQYALSGKDAEADASPELQREYDADLEGLSSGGIIHLILFVVFVTSFSFALLSFLVRLCSVGVLIWFSFFLVQSSIRGLGPCAEERGPAERGAGTICERKASGPGAALLGRSSEGVCGSLSLASSTVPQRRGGSSRTAELLGVYRR